MAYSPKGRHFRSIMPKAKFLGALGDGNISIHEQEKKLTTERISLARPFSYDGGPTLASRISCFTELDTN